MIPTPRTPRPMPETEPLIGTAAAGEALIEEVTAVIDELEGVIREETRLVREGLLFAAADLEAEKNRVSGAYLRLRARLKANTVVLGRLCATRVEELRRRHEVFTALLRENLAVLAIAREVSEDLVRTVSDAVGKRAAPRTYGRDAGTGGSALAGARGIAVDRRL
ncbi:MAG: flagellar protein FlgN [Siculibacillus sp.]|nr:flagellar protein FlgN [Siculibacillus sp.]